jgi:hypothetical protein
MLACLLALLNLFGTTTKAAESPPHTPVVVAQATSVPASELREAFDLAASRWGVPVELLMAVGYVESHWEQRGGEPSMDGGYGVMHLVDGAAGTLQRATELTGRPIADLKLHAAANIEGGAALLRDISRQLSSSGKSADMWTRWFEAVAEYSGAQDAWVRDEYAREVFRVLAGGASAKLTSGETLAVPPADGVQVPARSSTAQSPNSEDYSDANWVPAHSNNYTSGRPWSQSSGLCSSIKYFVVHDTEGSYNSAINWFKNSSSGVSAHYVIRSSDGHMTQMVRNADTGHHAGSWKYNICSIGIEHEGYMNQSGWYTEPMYRASAKLVATMSDRYGIKKDRSRVIAHSEVPGATHQDPGPRWDWAYYMGLVRGDSRRSGLVDNTDSGFSASPAQLDADHAWWTYGSGYGGSSTLTTKSVTSQSSSENSGTWTAYLPSTGYYDLYAFVPYVDNNTADTENARYTVYASDGAKTAAVSQKAITDRGVGDWAHLGKFHFNAWAEARVYLDDYTGESGRNVW